MADSNSAQFQGIKQLIEEKDKLVQEGKYLEAEEIKQIIRDMKKGNNTQKVGELYEFQVKEREVLEGDYETERKVLEEKWDKKIQEYANLERNKKKNQLKHIIKRWKII